MPPTKKVVKPKGSITSIWDDEVLIRVLRKLEIRKERMEVIGDPRSKAIARQANNILVRLRAIRATKKEKEL